MRYAVYVWYVVCHGSKNRAADRTNRYERVFEVGDMRCALLVCGRGAMYGMRYTQTRKKEHGRRKERRWRGVHLP